ncbi:MAG: DUF2256 domain-containing protein [Pseudomonadota bacterium]|nr:DUF2256 domain-containing protein [Pseudomonadota bacterium]MED5518824.1 DUF2256 domain-containing protein [Pseudomonadota bacterium]
MVGHRKKGDLPTKPCLTCGRPFAWRKKWAACWDEVKYCSKRCRGDRPKETSHETPPPSH